MRYLYFVFISVHFISCTTTNSDVNINEFTPKTIRIEVLTEEPNYDELSITYYEYQTDTYNLKAYTCNYDDNGNPEPIIINLENYDFRYVSGEVYRNNSSESGISLKIFSDDEEIVSEYETGDGTKFVTLTFNYDLKNNTSI